MKSVISAAFVLLALATAPIAAIAGSGANARDVSYQDAMDCSAVFSVLSTSSRRSSEAADFEDSATRWLVIAMRRDGSGDGSYADAALIPLIEELIDTLDAIPSAARRETFMYDMVDFCDTEQERIADEFNSIWL